MDQATLDALACTLGTARGRRGVLGLAAGMADLALGPAEARHRNPPPEKPRKHV